MQNAPKMLSTHSRWLLVTCLAGSLLTGCGSDDPAPPGTAGTNSGGSASGGSGGSGPSNGGTSSGGSATGGSSNPTPTAGTGGSSAQAGTSSGGTSSGGSGGSATAGSGGSATGGGNAGGSGGSAGGTDGPTAVANITGLGDNVVTGTATFTQGATMTKLVLDLTACPDGPHASHLHEEKNCGANGADAGGHWVNGEGITQYTCANNKGSVEFSKPTSQWTVGGAAATDVTQFSFMVHEGATGPRIGCGLVNVK